MEQVMGIVKKNLVSIICALIVIVAIAATFWPIAGMFTDLQTKAGARAGAYNQLRDLITKERHLPVVSLKEGATGEKLEVFPTEEVIRRGEKVKADIAAEAKAMFAEAVKMNQGDKKVLSPEALPEPPRGTRYVTVVNTFQKAYAQEMDYANADANARNKSMPARELKKMGMAPTPEQIKAEQDRVAKAIRTNDLQVDPKGKPLNEPQVQKKITEVTAAIPMQMQDEVAKACTIYVDPGSLYVVERILPPAPAQRVPVPDIFWAQMSYWLQQDVLRAIAEANAGASDVSNSAVKRILKISLPVGPNGFTTPRATANTQGGNQPDPNDPNATQPQVPTDPTQPIAPNYVISPTGRYSNALYDVIQFKMTLIVDAARVPQVLQTLSKNRFLTVYSTNVTVVDSGAHQAAGYFYGPLPVVQLDMECEALFLREWTKQYMPPLVRRSLGVVEETAAPAAQ